MADRRALTYPSLTHSLLRVLLGWLCVIASPWSLAETTRADVFYIAPTVEGLFACKEAGLNPAIQHPDLAENWCIGRGLDGSSAIRQLLNTLEPGGAQGKVQVGYIVTLQLLGLYKQTGSKWQLDEQRIDAYLRLITRVDRPVLIYLALNHFDTQGPITQAIAADPNNLMLTARGTAPISQYFGYPAIPYTLQTSDKLWVNQLRFHALKHVIQRLQKLPKSVRQRIIGYSLAGEVHHFFRDFESGMGNHQEMDVTDYSPRVIEGFRQWLLDAHGDLQGLNKALDTRFSKIQDVPVPRHDIRQKALTAFVEHYDAFANGHLPFAGWLWDPRHLIKTLSLYVNGTRVGEFETGFNRLDVYRTLEAVTDPNTGFRLELDFSRMPLGQHVAQVVAEAGDHRYLVAEHHFTVMGRLQRPPLRRHPRKLLGLRPLKELPDVQGWLDLPGQANDLYFNPLARLWDTYRDQMTRQFLDKVFDEAVAAGAPADRIFSHQIVPRVNSSWNHRLFAVDTSITPPHPWRAGINLYGGAVSGPWTQRHITTHSLKGYGVPEMHPQQWKRPGVALRALELHRELGARFVSPYYFSIVPDRFKGGAAHGVNAMELRPDNPRDGSDQFYHAIRTLARQ